MLRSATRCGWLWAVVLMCAAGCERSGRRAVYPVVGRLLVGAQPAAGAHVVFHPVDRRQLARAVAIAGPDGAFRLMTYTVDDGAPAGDYIVTIFWRDETIPYDECADADLAQHDRLGGFYFDGAKSPLRATVRPAANDLTLRAIDPRQPGSWSAARNSPHAVRSPPP